MNYFYQKLEEAADQFRLDTVRRRALYRHMLALARVLEAVEWNDSGDGDHQEDALIDKLLSPSLQVETAIRMLNEAREEADALLARLEGKS